MRIALFITCFNDRMFPRTRRAVTERLERLGHTAEFPQGQICCGQLHFDTGYRPEILPMVRRIAELRGLRPRGRHRTVRWRMTARLEALVSDRWEGRP